MTDYKLMPKQITKEMADAFWEEYSKDRADDLLTRCYKALYVAAPQPAKMEGDINQLRAVIAALQAECERLRREKSLRQALSIQLLDEARCLRAELAAIKAQD